MGKAGDSTAVAKRMRFVRVVGMTPLAQFLEAPVDGYVRIQFRGGIPRVIPEWAVSHPCDRCVEAHLLGNPVPKLCAFCNAVEREASPAAPRGAVR